MIYISAVPNNLLLGKFYIHRDKDNIEAFGNCLFSCSVFSDGIAAFYEYKWIFFPLDTKFSLELYNLFSSSSSNYE